MKDFIKSISAVTLFIAAVSLVVFSPIGFDVNKTLVAHVFVAEACCGGDGPGADNSHGHDQTPVVTYVVKKPVCTLTVSPATVDSGDDVILQWTTNNAYAVTINQGIGSVTLDGSKSVKNVTASKTYTLKATGTGGTVTCSDSVTVKVPPPPPPEKPVCTFDVSPSTIDAGDSITLSWTTTNATNVTINQGVGTVALDGSKAVNNVTASKTYTLTATGSGGTVTCSDNVVVEIPEEKPAPYCDIWADPSHVQYGQGTTISWTSSHATSATLNQGIGSVSTNSSRFVSNITSARTYTLTVWGEGGSATCSTEVDTFRIPPPPHNPPPYCSITITNTYGVYGYNQQTLTWNSTNATSAIVNPVIGVVPTSGSRAISAAYGQSYVMTVWGPGGTATCETRYTPPTPTPIPPYVSLTQIPYTGFDFGPVGNAMYWVSLITIALGGAYFMLYFRGGVFALAGSLLPVRDARSTRLAEFAPLPATAFVRKEARLESARGDSMSVTRSASGAPKIVITRA